MMRALFIIFMMLCSINIFAAQKEYNPEKADIIFQIAGSGEFSTAIADASDHSGKLRLCHVAIVDVDSLGKPCIIEASDEKGVTVTDFVTFVNSTAKINGKPGVIIKRLKIPFNAEEAISKARSFIGQPYDWNFLPDNGKMYCSELVCESFFNNDGERIFKSVPLNFKDKNGNIPKFWTDLFIKLGTDMPQGVDGSNPNDMFMEPVLTEVYRFF